MWGWIAVLSSSAIVFGAVASIIFFWWRRARQLQQRFVVVEKDALLLSPSSSSSSSSFSVDEDPTEEFEAQLKYDHITFLEVNEKENIQIWRSIPHKSIFGVEHLVESDSVRLTAYDQKTDSIFHHLWRPTSQPSQKAQIWFRRLVFWLHHPTGESSDQQEKAANFSIPLPSPKRRLTAIINPKSGAKGGNYTWNILKPLLQISQEAKLIEWDSVIVTERPLHACEEAAKLQRSILESQFISSTDNVSPPKEHVLICVGGDGTLHEIINGLMSEAPSDSPHSQIHLAVIPAGSGNGLAATLGIFSPRAAALNIIHGHKHPLDLMKTRFMDPQNSDQEIKKVFAFLQVSYGAMSDIDFDSEWARSLGDVRFILAAVYNIFSHKHYRMLAKFVPKMIKKLTDGGSSTEMEATPSNEPLFSSSPTENFCWVGVVNAPILATGFIHAPHARVDDGLLDIILVPSDVSRGRLFKYLFHMALETKAHLKYPEVRYFQTNDVSMQPLANTACILRLDIDGENYPIAEKQMIFVSTVAGGCSILVS